MSRYPYIKVLSWILWLFQMFDTYVLSSTRKSFFEFILMKHLISLTILSIFSTSLFGQHGRIDRIIEDKYANLESLYINLHQSPELSSQEEKTSQKMVDELKNAGFDVTQNFGGYGVVGVLKNGEGPVVLVRTDMDALPLLEKTGLEFASQQKATLNGNEVDVMHACGHDIHMTVFTGTAQLLADLKDQWQGTLIMVAQPAEETGIGAKRMLEQDLYGKYGTPDHAMAFHVSAELESGKIGYCPGPVMASVTSIKIVMKGQGGHGAYPHMTIDPVVLSARAVMAFQTLVSRETSPLESLVITVGAINGGFKHNIIPDEVEMLLTMRSYSEEVRKEAIEGLKRITTGIAISAGLPEEKYPEVIVEDSFTPAVINDVDLTHRWVEVLHKSLGSENLIQVEPVMAGEDFGQFGSTKENVPICLMWLGTVSPANMQDHLKNGTELPPLHSPLFAPYLETTIKTGVKSMVGIVMDLMKK